MNCVSDGRECLFSPLHFRKHQESKEICLGLARIEVSRDINYSPCRPIKYSELLYKYSANKKLVIGKPTSVANLQYLGSTWDKMEMADCWKIVDLELINQHSR